MRITLKRMLKCPRCRGTDIKQIVYGMPGLIGKDDSFATRRIVSGGCVVTGAEPRRQCAACNFKW